MRNITPVVLLLLLGVCEAGEDIFHSDPEHAWNRLHSHFHSRTTAEGKCYSQEGLEPLFVRRSRFLTEGASHQTALLLLDQFLKEHQERLVRDPLKRAILQRDLWAVFQLTADPDLDQQPERRELQKRLVAVMRRVALTKHEIARLPDNLSLAVKSKTFADEYDPSHPERPFLPGNLLNPAGPWLMLGDRWGWKGNFLAAPIHAEAINGRSVFLIFLRLPGGREATKAYLKKLERVRIGQDEVPQIPMGTQVALLRRLLLFDESGVLRLTPMTESLQIRAYQMLEAPDNYEFTLRRKSLFAGRAGGLHPVAADEINYFDVGSVMLSPDSPDPFETGNERPAPVIMKSCAECHPGSGIHGFRSMFIDRYESPALCAAEDLEDQVRITIDRASKTYAWGLLQGLWEGP